MIILNCQVLQEQKKVRYKYMILIKINASEPFCSIGPTQVSSRVHRNCDH